ncbi:MAG: UDPglucose 6-dehydrogenase, partial [Gammaproteobacteria bacterium]
MKIAVWGQELTAWVTAGALAQSGNDVYLVSESKIEDPITLMGSSIHNEPGLRDLITSEFASKRLRLVKTRTAIGLDTHVLSLNPGEFAAAEQIVGEIVSKSRGELLIINQSHFGIGATDKLQGQLTRAKGQSMAYFAENISEGEALNRFRKPDSLIFGCENQKAIDTIRALYHPFCSQLEHWFMMTPKEAEFTKFSVIGMLALRIGYINELANLGEQLDVDIDVVRQALGADPRVGRHHLSPGCGFGGNTFPQTIGSLAQLLSETRQSTLLQAVLKENEKQKEQPFRKLWRHYECDIRDRTIAIWGASFKPGSASIDSAPSVKVIEALIAQQAQVRIHDPEAHENIHHLYHDNPQVKVISNKYDALKNADALLLLT